MNNYNLKLNKKQFIKVSTENTYDILSKHGSRHKDTDAIYFKNGSRQTREPTFV